jgi:hypothetical protein
MAARGRVAARDVRVGGRVQRGRRVVGEVVFVVRFVCTVLIILIRTEGEEGR